MIELQKRIGYTFKNPALLTQALTLAHGNKAAAYERLEFLGDRVVNLIVADMLLNYFKKEKEGDIAKRFTALVREESFAELARSLDIAPHLITDAPELRDNNSVLADVFEAIIAAIYKDGGFNAAEAFVKQLIEPLLDKNMQPPVDPKTELQEMAHRYKLTLPIYTIIEQSGPAHAPLFKVSVKVGNYPETIAEGSSKKTAEQEAAKRFLDLFERQQKHE